MGKLASAFDANKRSQLSHAEPDRRDAGAVIPSVLGMTFFPYDIAVIPSVLGMTPFPYYIAISESYGLMSLDRFRWAQPFISRGAAESAERFRSAAPDRIGGCFRILACVDQWLDCHPDANRDDTT
ncbi:MAG: hypothetical protein ACYC6L_13060 [Anaerolineae bacterium]